ncbi:hypothetical protein OXX59_004040 [Metschnikowia pulcherrima]
MSAHDDQQPTKARARISLSCAQCKRRKVKCDRKLPCSSCVKHNVPETCGYFGDQVVAQASETENGVSVFRAFADNSGRAFRSRDSIVKHENTVSPRKLPPNGPLSGSKRLREGEGIMERDPKQFADDFSRSITTGGYMGRFPTIDSSRKESAPDLGYSLPAPGPVHPVAPLPSMGPGFSGSRPNLGPVANLAPGTYPQQMFHSPPSSAMSPVNGQLGSAPGTFYPSTSYHLNPLNCRNGTLSAGLPNGPGPIRSEMLSYSPFPQGQHAPGCGPHASMSPSGETLNAHEIGLNLQPLQPRSAPLPPQIAETFPRKNVSKFSWYGVNPHDAMDPNEELDLYSGYNPIYAGLKGRTMNHGPFSWYSYVQKDHVLRGLWDFTREPPKNTVKRKVLCLNEKDDDAPQSKDALLSNDLKAELNKRTLSLGLTVFEGEVDSGMHLLGRIKLMLPTKRAVSILVNRFFKSVYCYFPLVDESHFRKEIQRILGPFSDHDEKYAEIYATKRYDNATLGILLLVLRMSYLAAFSNRKTDNEQVLSSLCPVKLDEAKYILTNPINIDVVPVAQLCLDQYDLYQRTNLTVLQCAVLIRAYLSIAPEEGDSADGYDSNVFNVMCIQIAYCMGLNREPSKIYNHSSTPSRDNLCRKLWFFIKLMDMKSSYHFGFPLMVDDTYNDIERPKFAPGISNVADERMEQKVCETLGLIADLYSQMRVILKKCVSIKQSMRVNELAELITRIENATIDKLGTLPQLLRTNIFGPEDSYVKVLRVKTYLNIKSFNLSIFYHLFLNYERARKDELAFFYVRKFFSISCCEYLVESLNLIKDRNLFDPDSVVPGLILNPPIVFLIHKSNQFNLRLLITFNHMIYKMTYDKDVHNQNLQDMDYRLYFARVAKLAKLMENFNRYSNSCLSMLSHRFFYAWRLSKVHSFLLDMVMSESFRKHRFEKGMETMEFTPDRIKELLDMAEVAHHAIKKNCQHDIVGGFNKPNAQESKPEVNLHHGDAEKAHQTLHPTDRPIEQSANIFSGAGDVRHAAPDGLQNHSSDVSTTSASTFDFADLDLGNPAEIDSLWHQINNFKHSGKQERDGAWDSGDSETGSKAYNAGGEWYQRLFALMAQTESFQPPEGSSNSDAYSHLPL